MVKKDIIHQSAPIIFLDYEYNKSHYRLIALDPRRQKELDAGPKAI